MAAAATVAPLTTAAVLQLESEKFHYSILSFHLLVQGNLFKGIDNWSGTVDLLSKVLKDPSENKLATLRSLLNEQATLSEQGGIFLKNS